MSHAALFAERLMIINEQSRDTGVLCIAVSLKDLISCLVILYIVMKLWKWYYNTTKIH